MNNNFRIIALLFTGFVLSISCKVKAPAKEKKQESNTTNNTAISNPAPYPTEPGTCVVQGYIISLLKNDSTQNEEPCKSFPCKAKVIITKSRGCGFGVYQKPVEGDTLDVNFTHSIASSEEFKGVYKAQVKLQGLKTDQLFEAQMRIKLRPMNKLSYEISNYDIVR
jgi:hypothetical protein